MESLHSLLVILLTLQGFIWKTDAAIAISSTGTVTVAEDLAAGATIKDLTATNAAGAVTWTITSVTQTNIADWFAISGSKLVVANGKSLDYESAELTASTATVNIAATDDASNDTQALVVTLTDVDEPPAFSGAVVGAYLNGPIAALSDVITITAADPEGAAVSYAITAGDAGKVVMGSSTGVISTTSGTTLANCYGTVTVTATDATSNVGTATAVICIGICTSNCDGSSGPSVHGSVLAFLVAALLTALKF